MNQQELFAPEKTPRTTQEEFGQYMTPAWAARELWEIYFGDVGPGAIGIEPTCGDGRFLQAIPKDVVAYGYEIDPALAAIARKRTGRKVETGDVLHANLPPRFDFVVGNPPFRAAFLDALLEKVYTAMDDGCRVGLILPAYFMQSPSRVVRWNKVWTLGSEILPRTLFPRSQLPLIFSIFTKDPLPQMKGMRLFVEAESLEQLRRTFRDTLEKGTGLWDPVVYRALRKINGRGHLSEIYEVVGSSRPTKNEWWREKVRQTLQRGDKYRALGGGIWELAA